MIVSSIRTNIPEGSYAVFDAEVAPGLPVVSIQDNVQWFHKRQLHVDQAVPPTPHEVYIQQNHPTD